MDRNRIPGTWTDARRWVQGTGKNCEYFLIKWTIHLIALFAVKSHWSTTLRLDKVRDLDTEQELSYLRTFTPILEFFGRFSFKLLCLIFVLQFRCCGTVGEQSYWGLSFTPPTCCENPLDTIGCANADTFFSGCNEIFSDYLINSRDIVGGIVIGIICIEVSRGFSFYIWLLGC